MFLCLFVYILAVVSVRRACVTMAMLGLRVFFCIFIALYEFVGNGDAKNPPDDGNVSTPRFYVIVRNITANFQRSIHQRER